MHTQNMEGEDSITDQFTQLVVEKEDNGCISDFINLQNIFPEEIWKLVIEKLLKESPDNFESLINSYHFFRNLLESQKTVYLFEKVFEIVALTVWKNEGLEGLPDSDVVKCRAVCSKWNQAVDKLIPEKFLQLGKESNHNQFDPIRSAFYSILRNNRFANFIDETFTSTNPNKTVGNFLRHFKVTHPENQLNGRDPMIWGTLTVNIRTPYEDDDIEGYNHYLEDINSILSKYGSYLYDFSIYIDDEDIFEHSAMLKEWFRHVPNLKELLFNNEYDLRNAEVDFQENYPFPQFKQLETLDIRALPYPVFQQMIMENCQISTLNLYWNVHYNLETLHLPNLKKLTMEFVSPEIVEKLGSPEVQWPLEALTVTFDNLHEHVDYVFVGCAALFQVIQNKFGNTLVNLHLSLYVKDVEARDAIFEDCRTFRLNLPNLKIIDLYMPLVLMCLDFLLPMRNNLEEILVTTSGSECPEMKQPTRTSRTIVQFIGFEGKMLDSNVWAIFKKLEKIKVDSGWDGDKRQSNLYFREDWMRNNVYV